MEFNQAFKQLKQSKEFKDWSSKNKDAFFSYAFKMLEGSNEQPWQLSFYRESTDKVITFVVNSEIEMQKEEEIFKKPDTKVKPIEMEKVNLPFKDILKKAEEFQKKQYSKELPSKTIAILQNLEEHGTIWNLTYITHALSTLNIKVNSENGKIMGHDSNSLMNFMKK